MQGEVKKPRSIRLFPTQKETIERIYGSVQTWVDENYRREFGDKEEKIKEVLVIRGSEKRGIQKPGNQEVEEITEDDF